MNLRLLAGEFMALVVYDAVLFTVMASRNPDTIIPLLKKTRNAVSLSEPQA